MYQLRFLDPAHQALKKLDRSVSVRILRKLDWLTRNAENAYGEGLRGELAGLLKIREGDYRILYEVIKDEEVILVHDIGHRSEIYKK